MVSTKLLLYEPKKIWLIAKRGLKIDLPISVAGETSLENTNPIG